MISVRVPSQMKFEIPSDPNYLPLLRSIIGQIADMAGFENKVSRSIVLAVDEAFTNIIKYAYLRDYSKRVLFTCTCYENRLEIILEDFGKHIKLEKIKHRDPRIVKPGGLGVFLIKEIMDEVNYEIKPNNAGTKLTLVKYI